MRSMYGQDSDPPAGEGWMDLARKWPKSTLLILAMEFCERYSFFGMRGWFLQAQLDGR